MINAAKRAEAGTSTLVQRRPGRRHNVKPTGMEMTMDSHITRPASGATVATVRGQFTTVYSLEPRAPIKPDPLDDISGPTAIAAHIGLTAERTLDLLERGLLPTRRVGGEWVCRRSRLAEIFGEVPANG